VRSVLRETGLLVALGLAAAAEEGRSDRLSPDGLRGDEGYMRQSVAAPTEDTMHVSAYSVDTVGRGERELVALVEGASGLPEKRNVSRCATDEHDSRDATCPSINANQTVGVGFDEGQSALQVPDARVGRCWAQVRAKGKLAFGTPSIRSGEPARALDSPPPISVIIALRPSRRRSAAIGAQRSARSVTCVTERRVCVSATLLSGRWGTSKVLTHSLQQARQAG
jgi:hypothetical protein